MVKLEGIDEMRKRMRRALYLIRSLIIKHLFYVQHVYLSHIYSKNHIGSASLTIHTFILKSFLLITLIY